MVKQQSYPVILNKFLWYENHRSDRRYRLFVKQHLPVLYKHLIRSYLKNDNLAVISLQVEGPGGGDEALSRADNVVAPTGHGLHHRGGFRAESHGPELRKKRDKMKY